tara:strand:+ start:149 stop:529 length:381 start_codon:yes stop_codon:yes gene_type:complete
MFDGHISPDGLVKAKLVVGIRHAKRDALPIAADLKLEISGHGVVPGPHTVLALVRFAVADGQHEAVCEVDAKPVRVVLDRCHGQKAPSVLCYVARFTKGDAVGVVKGFFRGADVPTVGAPVVVGVA